MIDSNTLYIIGLTLVICYLLMGIDDFIWDIITISKRICSKNVMLKIHELDNIPPKLLAVAIAAWREDNVLGDVIDNFVSSTHYPKAMYHIFIGVYPNDEATIQVARNLEMKYSNVHAIINSMPGPTSKAQNINYVIQQIKQFEIERKWQFASLTIHDSEDVVHPYELKVTNYLIDTYEALQFPVFPLIQMPKFSNFLRTITAGTYADEFAENHFSTMVNRREVGAFLPSAGTGFALSRKTIDSFGDGDILPSDSLTEDYRLSLTLFERGIPMHYVLEKVPRITKENKVKWDFISTRSMFPATFKMAVKQKTRWILGITMQSFKFRDIFQIKGLRFAGRYSLYKDLKAKVGNLLAFVGYPVLVYYFCSFFIQLDPIYPVYSLSWYLGIFVTVMMLERQIFRGVAIYHVYGFRSMFFACLFPPILPLRLVWGNIINMVATIKAYKQHWFGNQNKKKIAVKSDQRRKETLNTVKVKALNWAKTDHSFLPHEILRRYHRMLGDVLLEKGFIDTDQLQYALRTIARRNQSIGSYLKDKDLITEEELLIALSGIKQIPYYDGSGMSEFNLSEFSSFFAQEQLHELLVAPLLKTDEGFVIAFCDRSLESAQIILRDSYDIEIQAVFASQDTVLKVLDYIFTADQNQNVQNDKSLVMHLFQNGIINYEQVIIAYNYISKMGQKEEAILNYMGLILLI